MRDYHATKDTTTDHTYQNIAKYTRRRINSNIPKHTPKSPNIPSMQGLTDQMESVNYSTQLK